MKLTEEETKKQAMYDDLLAERKKFHLKELQDEEASGNADPNTSFMILILNGYENDAITYYNMMRDKLDIWTTVIGDCELAKRLKCDGLASSPIYDAFQMKMYKLVELLMQDDRVDINSQDKFGETFASSAIYAYANARDNGDKEAIDFCKRMFNKVIDNENFNINAVDMNDDTVLNIAAEDESLLWAVEKILTKPNVDVNKKNFFKNGPFTSAAIYNNTKAMELLMQRTDLVISEDDIKEAKDNGYEVDVATRTISKIS